MHQWVAVSPPPHQMFVKLNPWCLLLQTELIFFIVCDDFADWIECLIESIYNRGGFVITML